MDSLTWLLYLLIFLMAFMYASVGHGGASGYLAVLGLMGTSAALMKPTALMLNVFVAGISFWHYYQSKSFRFNLFWPFAITSIPASFAGALIPVDEKVYKIILGICLLISVIKILIPYFNKESRTIASLPLLPALLAGFLIGILSGMIGIGGGIILSPLILLMHWGNIKETAAVSALFIVLNSLSGLSAIFLMGDTIPPECYIYLVFAVAGGYAGAWLGSRSFNFLTLRYMLAAVLVIASLKLLIY